jgi:hypothetical protein
VAHPLIVVALAAIVAVRSSLAPACSSARASNKRALVRLVADTKERSGTRHASAAARAIAWNLELWPLCAAGAAAHYALRGHGRDRRVRLCACGNGFVRDAESSFRADVGRPCCDAPSWIAGGDVDIAATSFDWMPRPWRRSADRVASGAMAPAAGDAVALGDVTVALTAFEDSVKGDSNDGGDLGVR